MTDPRIAEGVKLVQALKIMKSVIAYKTLLTREETKTVISTLEDCAALVAAGEVAGGRPGMVMVPVEPTEAMMKAGQYISSMLSAAHVAEIYQRMLSAAPASPVGEDDLATRRLVSAEEIRCAGQKDTGRSRTCEEAATRITELQAQLSEAREALKPIAELFADAQGRLTPDYGEVSGRDFQMMTMHPDPEGLASDLRRAARTLETKAP